MLARLLATSSKGLAGVSAMNSRMQAESSIGRHVEINTFFISPACAFAINPSDIPGGYARHACVWLQLSVKRRVVLRVFVVLHSEAL